MSEQNDYEDDGDFHDDHHQQHHQDHDHVYQETTPLVSSVANYATEGKPAARRGSLGVVVLTVFLQSIGFTVVLPSMWYYIQSLGGNQLLYGGVVAVYSVGQFLGSPLFGSWSNHRPAREVLIVSLLISAIANIAYALVGYLPFPVWMAFITRFFVGLGAGNVAVCRAYASEASDLNSKVATMAKLSASQGIGFVLGPGIGFLLSFLHVHIGGKVELNKYTAPGYFSGILGVLNVILIIMKFKEIRSHEERKEAKLVTESTPRSEMIPIIVSIFLFFVVISVFAVFETVTTLLTQDQYGWDVSDNGILLLCVGLVSIVVFFVISRPVVKKHQDRHLLFFGLSVQVIGLLLLIIWRWPWRLQTHLNMYQFLAAAFLIGVGYPISSTFMYAIYSKVLNPRFQGTKMGWLTAGGSLSRMLGPLWATNAYLYGGTELLFLSTAGLVLFALFVLVIFYTRLVPHRNYAIAVLNVN